MRLRRRSFLALSGSALAASLAPVRLGLASGLKSLMLVQPFGEQSMALTAFKLLQPDLRQALNCDVSVQTVPGNDGFNAIDAILGPKPDEALVVGSAMMGPQYVEKVVKHHVRIEELTPIVKLTNGYSVVLFTKRDGPLKTWADLAAIKSLKVSSLQRGAAAFVAELMMERKGGIKAEVTMHPTIPEIEQDVLAGRSHAGIITTALLLEQLDTLQPIVTFGAQRNPILTMTPTFAEIVHNPKLSFTESIGVFAAPKTDPALASALTKAFMTAGQDPKFTDAGKAANLPFVVNPPDMLVQTLERNEHVLKRVLG